MNSSALQPEALNGFRDEHHHSLEFCDRIREGLFRGIALSRIQGYTLWFQENYLEPHFEFEQKYIFPLLGDSNVRVKKALANHRRLRRLFRQKTEIERTLNRIEEELGTYIRFEERILYHEIEQFVSPQQLTEIKARHEQLEMQVETWTDRFWEEGATEGN